MRPPPKILLLLTTNHTGFFTVLFGFIHEKFGVVNAQIDWLDGGKREPNLNEKCTDVQLSANYAKKDSFNQLQSIFNPFLTHFAPCQIKKGRFQAARKVARQELKSMGTTRPKAWNSSYLAGFSGRCPLPVTSIGMHTSCCWATANSCLSRSTSKALAVLCGTSRLLLNNPACPPCRPRVIFKGALGTLKTIKKSFKRQKALTVFQEGLKNL